MTFMECPVCFEEKAIVACDRCSQGVCRDCSVQLDKCPICQTPYVEEAGPVDYGPVCMCVMFLAVLVCVWQIYVKN
jgi:hypothetical protein